MQPIILGPNVPDTFYAALAGSAGCAARGIAAHLDRTDPTRESPEMNREAGS